jgi:hypothetical protein
VKNVVAALAIAKKGTKETTILTEQAYSNRVQEQKSTTFRCYSNPNESKHTDVVIADIVAAVEEARHQTVAGLASSHGQSNPTIRRILSDI